MSLDNITPSKKATQNPSATPKASTLNPPQESLKCPRCDSPNTKFCYYNNYSLTQPRYFCKTCRRYWTKGGALRNVPIGGGCRKKKKKSRSASFDIAGLMTGLSPPAMDFQLSGISNTNPPTNLDSLGLGFPLIKQQLHGGIASFQEIGCAANNNNLASSIESLSCVNQDLHWKLQQQRLASLLGDGAETGGQQKQIANESQPLQPILFQNLEISKPSLAGDLREDGGGGLETEWFFDNPTANTGINTDQNKWNGGMQSWNQFNHFHSF